MGYWEIWGFLSCKTYCPHLVVGKKQCPLMFCTTTNAWAQFITCLILTFYKYTYTMLYRHCYFLALLIVHSTTLTLVRMYTLAQTAVCSTTLTLDRLYVLAQTAVSSTTLTLVQMYSLALTAMCSTAVTLVQMYMFSE